MSNLKIAVQKSGRLSKGSLQLLKEAGIGIDNGKDQLKVTANNFPVEILFLRNSDIPKYIEDGVADVAILGENVIIEKRKKLQVLEKLNFAKCRLSIAVPKNENFDSLNYLQGKRIASSYPNTLREFLLKNNISAEIHEISGSVEIAPNIDLADAVCDLVSSGNTLFKNGLKEVSTILYSEACLVANQTLKGEKKAILDKLIFRIQTVLRAKRSRYILLNTPNEKIDEISRILPVLKSPTIMPLAEKGWSSLHSVIEEGTFWNKIDELKACGAQGILVMDIEKLVV